MPTYDPIKFLLNRQSAADEVGAPAFSITKILSTAALVLTPLVAILVKAFTDITFTSGQVVVLVVAVLGLLAIVSAADVIARAIATAAASNVGYVPIEPAVDAWQVNAGAGPDFEVNIIGSRRNAAGGEFLVIKKGDGAATWVPESGVRNLTRA